MRRLPIYFLIDVSESMVGGPIRQVEDGMGAIIKGLKADPYALDNAHVSVVVFAGKSETLVPLQEIVQFYPPRFPIGSGTSLGEGLTYLISVMKANQKKNTLEQKGDWKPLVFLFTDGASTDDPTAAIAAWKREWASACSLVIICMSEEVDTAPLLQLTEHVLRFKDTCDSAYQQFFKWVTASITSHSGQIDAGLGDAFSLANLNPEFLEKVKKDQVQHADRHVAIIDGKCSNTKKRYLIKYVRDHIHAGAGLESLGLNTLVYRLDAGYAIDGDAYERLSPGNKPRFSIKASELMGAPTCPCCGNQYGLAVCSCGQIHCVGDEDIVTCPWCLDTAQYGSGNQDFNINTKQG